jgi:hypothetical protein
MSAPAGWNPYVRKMVFWTGICLVSIPLLIMATGCSPRPRNQYAQDLVSAVDIIYTNLEQYRTNPSGGGKPTGPGGPEVKGKGTGPEAGHEARSYAEAVGASLQKLMDSLETVSFQVFWDITDEKGYEEWATRTNKILREKADRCLDLVSQIKLEYKKNPGAVAYKAVSPTQVYPVVWLTLKDELVFSTNGNKGLMIEHVLRQDFRATLDALHRKQIKQ